jgi:two-component system phosphate regulon sensor histidine kinase PhoR
LVTNAIKFTPKGGTVSLRWWDDGKQGYFSVTDSGIGIDARHIPRLTERFYRVDSGRSRETGGTGLGLAIVKHVLMQHDAHLEISSTVGKGSTFTAVFPAERLVQD